MAKVGKGSVYEAHPDGWFLFAISSCEEVEGDYGGKKTERFQWTCESTERREDGYKFFMNVFTGRNISVDPKFRDKCHLNLLSEGCGVKPEDLDDTEDLVGKVFAGKVVKGEDGKTKIAAFDTRDRVRPASKSKASKADPFEEE